MGNDQYQPPQGPPPGYSARQQEQYQPPPGPPLNQYQPPPGPPPSKRPQQGEAQAPPPYDPWLAVPDNALLPPPPSFFEERSPTANAEEADAVRAHQWCDHNPLWPPRYEHNGSDMHTILSQSFRLTRAPQTSGPVLLSHPSAGRTHVRSTSNDTILLSDLPLYLYTEHSPLWTKQPKRIYYEVHIQRMGKPGAGDAGIALGFLAPPYPAWRLPGWHRASLGVHGDDGRRYVNNTYGGQDFLGQPFKVGDVVGIGMNLQPPLYQGEKKCRVEVFFARNGKREAGWDLWEERDRDAGVEGDPEGLGGDRDLLAAVGCFGAVEFEVRFKKEECKFNP
ncbi:hypothetical protein K431DRAFT_284985 [Polychaeton citri CBS 116435]|uniref:SPRY domain-containing protein n=1 Tax=Polychaeton citri CBS 116435 TaxID=1314669 RepID=A0A9P4QAL2_9PEZI|nr:hypothetical protein K431DRAFT_284985 [Polychaeton citri CBS 116435]